MVKDSVATTDNTVLFKRHAGREPLYLTSNKIPTNLLQISNKYQRNVQPISKQIATVKVMSNVNVKSSLLKSVTFCLALHIFKVKKFTK